MAIDYTNRDYDGFREDMKSSLKELLPEYTDTTDTDAGMVLLSVLARGLDILSYAIDTQANENYLITMERRENIIDRCYELAYTPKEATPSYFKQVFVLASAQATDFVIPRGTVVKTKDTVTENSVYFETMNDLTIPAGKMGNETLNDEYLYTVDVIQGQTVEGELLGSSDGSPSQEFTIDYTPVLIDTISIVLNEGFGYEPWTRVDNFIDSSPISKHFRIKANNDGSAKIVFGDGVFGKIPNAFTNGIFAYYRIGGGNYGNVSANSITELDESIGEIASTFNPSTAYILGADRESIDSVRVNAPNHIRTKWGAITLQDHTDLVREYFSSNIKFVTSMRDELDIDKVNVYVVPLIGSTASAILKDEIKSFFEMDRQYVGGSINVLDATFTPMNLTGKLTVDKEYSRTKVYNEVVQYITDFFAVGNYDFNTPFYPGDLENIIKDAILGVVQFRLSVPVTDVVTPAQNEIYTLGTLDVTAVGGIV